MLIGVNALDIRPSFGGGEERYLRNVLATMREIQPGTRFVIFTDKGNHDSFEGWDRVRVEEGRRFGLLPDNGAQLDRAAKQSGIDALFSSLATAPSKVAVPLVVYAMNLSSWENEAPKRRLLGSSKLKIAKQICANAAALVAPSEFIQRKFLEVLEIPLNKVIVAPLGVDPIFAQPQACLVSKPYLLAVGDTHNFKNIPCLRNAFAQLKDEIPHTLIVVGRPCEAEPDNWGARVMRIEQCPTAHLAGLYQHCDVFIQPSLCEGSGVTVLEAMRAGAPVVTSRSGGIEEVAADAPIFFNPESVSSIVSSIRWALQETPEQRTKRTRFGKQLAAEFTWEKCAWKTLSAFNRT